MVQMLMIYPCIGIFIRKSCSHYKIQHPLMTFHRDTDFF